MSQETKDRLRREAEERNEKDRAECVKALGKFCRALGAEPAKHDYHEGGVYVDPFFKEEKPSGAEVYEYRLMQYTRQRTAGSGSQVLPSFVVGTHTDSYPAHEFVKLIDVWIKMFQAIDGAAQLSGHKLRLTNEGWKWLPLRSEEP